MNDSIDKLIASGDYDQALSAAKRLSIDLLKQSRREEAAVSLARAAGILCTLNNPSKARSFTQEALDLSARSDNRTAAGYSYAISALASLRLGDIGRAETDLDRALELTAGDRASPLAAEIRLVGAEISMSKEDFVEARVFAEDAASMADGLKDTPLRARATLIKAVCEERADNLPRALELLGAVDSELARTPHVETAWQAKAARASALQKQGQDAAAEALKTDAVALIEGLANRLPKEARERYLKNPAIATATGNESSGSGLFRQPVQVPARPPATARHETAFLGFRPILEVIKKINSELNLRNLISTILDTMIDMCNAERGTIVVFENEKFKIEISRARGGRTLDREQMGISRGILKLIRDKGRRIVADDAQQDPELRLIDSVQDQKLLSVLCVPLRVKLRLVGAIYLDNPTRRNAFGPREIEIAEVLTDHAAVAIDNALLHIKSIHDTLTNLYNHSHFEKRLEAEVARSRRHARPCSLLMLDIDDFKVVNDQHGHHAGNELLRAISKVLASAVRNADLVARIQERDPVPILARYGGDEFEIILPETGRDGARSAAGRILSAVQSAKFRYNDAAIRVSVSIGSATFPEDAPDDRDLILRADEALYAAKRAGKNRYVQYGAAP